MVTSTPPSSFYPELVTQRSHHGHIANEISFVFVRLRREGEQGGILDWGKAGHNKGKGEWGGRVASSKAQRLPVVVVAA